LQQVGDVGRYAWGAGNIRPQRRRRVASHRERLRGRRVERETAMKCYELAKTLETLRRGDRI
jgi:hypothetical protein